MGAVLLLIAWDATKKRVLDYVVPIWEITGTFGAFWVVTSYFAYPTLLIPVAAIFSPLLIIFLILFVARNASIAFGEFITKRRWLDEVKLYKAYALSTIVLGLVVLVLLSALVGGQGVDLSTGSFSLASWATAGSVVFVLGTLVLGRGTRAGVLRLRPSPQAGSAPHRRRDRPLSPFVLPDVSSAIDLVDGRSRPLDLGGGAALPVAEDHENCGQQGSVHPSGSIVIFSLQPLIYPKVIGQALSVDAVTTSGAMAGAFLSVTVVGAVLLAVMIGLYISLAARGTSGPDAATSSS